MPKKIMPGFPIYVAHEMLGKYDGRPVVIDNRNGNQLDPQNINHKILVYERQVKEWFLVPARRMLEIMEEQASFAILAICLAYLEGVQQCIEGNPVQVKAKLFQKLFSAGLSILRLA